VNTYYTLEWTIDKLEELTTSRETGAHALAYKAEGGETAAVYTHTSCKKDHT